MLVFSYTFFPSLLPSFTTQQLRFTKRSDQQLSSVLLSNIHEHLSSRTGEPSGEIH